MTTTEEIQELAEQKLPQNRFGVRKELKTLHELLHEGETVLDLGSGVYGGGQGLVVVTDQRVMFYARSLGRSLQEDFRYSKISSVQSETGMLGNGKLVIFASGNQADIHTIYPRERAGGDRRLRVGRAWLLIRQPPPRRGPDQPRPTPIPRSGSAVSSRCSTRA